MAEVGVIWIAECRRRAIHKERFVGHELYYKTDEHHIGNVSIRRWKEISKLIPMLVDFINKAMQKEWNEGTARDVSVFAGGKSVPQIPPPQESPPVAEPLSLNRMLAEERLTLNEIYFNNAGEWNRLLAWCDFLADRDGVLDLYRPLVDWLRLYVSVMSDSA
jgi:hypothetical protein